MLLNRSFIAFLLGAFSLVGAMISTSDADAHRQLFRRLGFTCPILPIPTPRVKLYGAFPAFVSRETCPWISLPAAAKILGQGMFHVKHAMGTPPHTLQQAVGPVIPGAATPSSDRGGVSWARPRGEESVRGSRHSA
jgi:hypothetical protein